MRASGVGATAMNVAVLGAGLAGLAAACELADRGCRVTLFERRPWAGGKTYSFQDPTTGEWLDNGQHVFLGCTTAYLAFLRRLGTLHKVRLQQRLRVPVYDAHGRRSVLWAAPLPPPFHLLPSFLTYRHLSPGAKRRIARVLVRVARLTEAERRALDHRLFVDWLGGAALSPEERRFWDFLFVPTLNCRAAEASAASALFVLREGFLASPGSSALGLPTVPLAELHVEPALRYLAQRGARVVLGVGVVQIEAGPAGVQALQLSTGERVSFDAYVSALPHRQLLAVLPPALRATTPFAQLERLATAPIVNLHLWYDRPVAPFDCAALLTDDLPWVFNRTRIESGGCPGERLVVSLSAAERYLRLPKAQVLAQVLSQLQGALPVLRGARLRAARVVKEPEATFRPAPGAEALRPGPRTPLPNLVLAGAWTDTGWPATMESAVRSGLAATQALLTDAPAIVQRGVSIPVEVS
jgi:squalene-associated FAD-dependent desaturase